jgi:hypothetical protein
MTQPETLELLSQMNEAQLDRLRQRLFEAERVLQGVRERYEATQAKVLALHHDYERSKKQGTSGVIGGKVSSYEYQTHQRYFASLIDSIRQADIEHKLAGEQLERENNVVAGLKNELSHALGKQVGVSQLQNQHQKRQERRMERASDDELSDNWAAKVR